MVFRNLPKDTSLFFFFFYDKLANLRVYLEMKPLTGCTNFKFADKATIHLTVPLP